MSEAWLDRGPWSRRARSVTALLLIVGAVALIVGWWGVSGTTERADQYGWLNVGVAGLIVIGTANCGWLVVGRRRFAAHAASMYERIDGLTVVSEGVGAAVARADTALVTGTGMRHYHRAECEYVRGKALSTATLARHQRAGRVPCPVCRP